MSKILVILWLGVLFLRLPSLFEPNRYADEDIYLTIGMALREGRVLYRDIHDNKPPLIYFTAAVARNVTSFRFILLLWNLIHVAIFYQLAKLILGNNRREIIVCILFVILSTLPLLEGNIANGEIFMIMPITAAMWLFWKNQASDSFKLFLGVGGLLALGFLFKVTAVFEAVAIGTFMLFYQPKRIWGLILGFGLPIIISIGLAYLWGAGGIYVRTALLQNIGYLSSWTGGSSSGLLGRAAMIFTLMGLVFLMRHRLNRSFIFLAVWSLMSLLGALLSSRPYPHYLLQIVAPFTLLMGTVALSRRAVAWSVVVLTTAFTIWQIVTVGFWYYPSWPYYLNFLQYTTGQISKFEHDNFFQGVSRNKAVSSYVKQHTQPGERIFVWGTAPAIYVLANRLPVGKYVTSYHIRDFDKTGETFSQIQATPPKAIVIFASEGDYLGFVPWVKSQYSLAQEVQDAQIYLQPNF